jgi:flagellar biosynthesis protein FlhF
MGLDKISSIMEDVGELKKQLTDIKTSLDSPVHINVDLPESLKELYKLMVKNGMDELLAYRFLKSKELDIADITGKAQLKNIILHELAAKIHVEKEYLTVLHNKVTMFMGPTGVGKTTTIAKIAADLVLKYNQRVCLITSDVFRIGAVEQLKTYAEIVSLPLYVATGADDLERIVREVSGEYDYILVDSTGRSPYDSAKLGSIGESLSVSPSIVPILVLSMAANHAEWVEIYDRSSSFEPKYVIFTKLDETRRFGAMANIVMKKQKPILLLSNGQGVPDDIEMPDGKKIAIKLLQEIPTLWKDN